MIIQCPNCSYSRDMPDERVPEGELTARCPSCGASFRFSRARAGQAREAREEGPARGAGQAREARDAREFRPAGEAPAPEGGGEWSFNPWDCAQSLQDYVPALYQTCLRVMFAPQRFYSQLRPGSILRSLVFFALLCAIQTLVEHAWGLFFAKYVMTDSADPQLRELANVFVSRGNLLMWLLVRCGVAVLQVYVFAGLLFLCWRFAARDRVDFSLVLQVLFYAEAPIILCVVPGVGSLAGMIWSFVCVLVGCRAAMRLSWTQVFAGVVPLLLVVAFSFAHLFSA